MEKKVGSLLFFVMATGGNQGRKLTRADLNRAPHNGSRTCEFETVEQAKAFYEEAIPQFHAKTGEAEGWEKYFVYQFARNNQIPSHLLFEIEP